MVILCLLGAALAAPFDLPAPSSLYGAPETVAPPSNLYETPAPTTPAPTPAPSPSSVYGAPASDPVPAPSSDYGAPASDPVPAPSSLYGAPSSRSDVTVENGEAESAPEVTVLRDDRVMEDAKYSFDIETSDGLVRSEAGEPGSAESGAFEMIGEYS